TSAKNPCVCTPPRPTCAMVSTDRDALVALYNATGGARWGSNTNWKTTAPLSEWYGVIVNDQGRVVELLLVNNNLKVGVHSQVWKPGHYLQISRYFVFVIRRTGPIPKELGKLPALETLLLNGNNLVG
ncbi:unnamed protein product, partial [Ectocarpus sp. 13 AM-2016]